MAKVTLRGLSWGHRRANGPLVPLTETFSARYPDIELDWVVRPLSDFEHQSLPQLASVYDLIVYDHPFSGSIVESGAFHPLSGRVGIPLNLTDSGAWLGPSMLSYRLGGTVWGLPIDAATQHAVYRADLLGTEPIPESWMAAIALGQRLQSKGHYLGIALIAPHALLTIGSLMANMGCPWETRIDQPFAIDRAGFSQAYDCLRQLLAYCPAAALRWNAIDLHDAMVARDDIAYCPCAYGYATYGEADQRKRLSFAPFAGDRAPFHAGSTLGGTGLAVSRATAHLEQALAFVNFAASQHAQRDLIPSRHGQPAATLAWHDPEIDARFNGFFSSTRSSIETAWIRPRYRGYIDFQAAAGQFVAASLQDDDTAAQLWGRLQPLIASVNP